MVIIIVFVILLILGIAGGVFYYFYNKKTPPDTSTKRIKTSVKYEKLKDAEIDENLVKVNSAKISPAYMVNVDLVFNEVKPDDDSDLNIFLDIKELSSTQPIFQKSYVQKSKTVIINPLHFAKSNNSSYLISGRCEMKVGGVIRSFDISYSKIDIPFTITEALSPFTRPYYDPIQAPIYPFGNSYVKVYQTSQEVGLRMIAFAGTDTPKEGSMLTGNCFFDNGGTQIDLALGVPQLGVNVFDRLPDGDKIWDLLFDYQVKYPDLIISQPEAKYFVPNGIFSFSVEVNSMGETVFIKIVNDPEIKI